MAAVVTSSLLRGADAPPERTLVDLLLATTREHGDEPAIDDGTAVLSYQPKRSPARICVG